MAFVTVMQHEQKALASNQATTFQIPVFGKLHDLIGIFRTGAGAPVTEAQLRAEVGLIRVTVDGRDIVNATVAKCLDAYETLGVNVGLNTGIDGAVELNFGRLLFADPVMRDVFAWGSQNVANIQVTVTGGTLVNVASCQFYSSRQNELSDFGAHAEYINYPQNFNATGQHTVDTLPRNLGSSYVMMLVDQGSAGVISNGEVRVNSVTIRENVPTNVNRQLLSNYKFQQPSGYFVHAFGDGAVAGQLPMNAVTDFRLLTTFTTAPGANGYNITALTLVNGPINAAK